MPLAEQLREQAERTGIAMDAALAECLVAYVAMLRRWNARLNLTRLDRDDAGLARLLVEPLAALPHLPARGRLIDIGSGGGSPGIPLKLARPGLALRMVEAKGRKAAFLRAAIHHLDLDRTEVLAERYEALLARRELRGAHDALTVRGVRVDGRSARELQTFVAPGGKLLLYRGPEAAGAWDDAPGTPAVEATASLPGPPGGRLVVLRRA